MSQYELDFWGSAVNTFHEEQKQIVYAPRMGLIPIWNCAHPPTFDLGGVSVIDIGGGPVSLLLKCVNFSRVLVVDPTPWPAWVKDRYKAHGVKFIREEGENFQTRERFDEAWIYNVLTHTDDPRKIIENARKMASVVRVFEWLEMAPRPGHPQVLHANDLNQWLGSPGFVAQINENGAHGRAFYGVFAGDSSYFDRATP